jgi:hypothetical protein
MLTTGGSPAPQKRDSTGCRGGVPTPPDCGGQLGHAQLTPRDPDVSRSAVTLFGFGIRGVAKMSPVRL